MRDNLRLEYELAQLEKYYETPKHKENSFYEDMREIEESCGSSTILGKFSVPAYYYDKASEKLMCTKTKV